MGAAFIGTEAVHAGELTKYDLRAHHQRVFPGVYAPRGATLALADRTEAAWLWSRRQGVVSGLAASAMHGAKWIDPSTPIELISPNTRPPSGISTRAETLLSGEVQELEGIPVTTPARTAFDLGRRLPIDKAVARLDALGNATALTREAVADIAAAHPGARNVRKLQAALDLYDPGAESPRETWLRLIAIRAGYARPITQIPVDCGDGYPRYYLDMGWPGPMIALEYDGGHHFQGPEQIRRDMQRLETLTAMDWIIIRVIAGMRAAEILYRLHQAVQRRGCTESEILAG